jgi:hypothetical protein
MMGACFCTGQCRETGVCPSAWEWVENGKVKPVPLNIIGSKVFVPFTRSQQLEHRIRKLEDEVGRKADQIAKLEGERNVLAGHLQDIYAHPASTPPILALAAGALRAFGFTVPPRWRLDH